jgi:predicted dehydrogenase
MEQVRVAVIGMGMGRAHAQHYRDCPEADLVALCDVDEARMAAVAADTHPRKTYTQIDALLADPEVDAVSVALPNFLHAPVTIQALEAGKHVLCEKPLALNAGEAERMVETARRVGRKLMVHFNVRFNPTSQAVKRAIDGGALGEVYYARSVWHRKRGIPKLGGWFTQKSASGGGALIDIGVHRLDLCLWLMGFPRPVSVTGATYGYLGRALGDREGKSFDVDDLAAAFIRFENGASLTLETSWASNTEKREDQWTQLFGVQGGAIIRNTDEGYQFEARLFQDVDGQVETEVPETPQPLETAQQHFCRSILNDTEPLAPGEQGLTVMRILDAIYESARTGNEVKLG